MTINPLEQAVTYISHSTNILVMVPPFLNSLCIRFISKFGTHIIVGVKMGGKDVIYMKQQHSSSLQPADVQKRLKMMADKRFLDANGQNEPGSEQLYQIAKVWTSLRCFPYYQ